jgi:hypothetical protein
MMMATAAGFEVSADHDITVLRILVMMLLKTILLLMCLIVIMKIILLTWPSSVFVILTKT